jgi:hypothetical protein
MEQFYQKTLFLKKKFTFEESGVEIEFKDSEGEFSLFIDFDKILPRKNIRIFSKQKKRVLRIGLILAALTFVRGLTAVNTNRNMTFAVIAMALIIAAITYGYYYFTQLKYYAIALDDNKRFQVLYNKPSHEAVVNFIDELYERRKVNYRNKYFFIEYENDRKKEIDKMNWLLSENIITENEFNVVIDEINEHVGN